MTAETATQSLVRVLESIGFPVKRIVYNGESDTFFTFQMLQATPSEYGDDDYESLVYTFAVTINTKKNHLELLADVLKRFRKEGFTLSSIEAESMNVETGFYYVPVIIKILEE